MLGESLNQRATYGAREAKKRGEPWVPDDLWRADFKEVNSALVQAGNALKSVLAEEQKKLAGMTMEQLEAQFAAELPRMAAKFTAEDWAKLDQVRMKQFTRTTRS